MRQGIDRMSGRVLERGIPEPTRFPAIELTEGLPPSWQAFARSSKSGEVT
jgi:hypothetical protein